MSVIELEISSQHWLAVPLTQAVRSASQAASQVVVLEEPGGDVGDGDGDGGGGDGGGDGGGGGGDVGDGDGGVAANIQLSLQI